MKYTSLIARILLVLLFLFSFVIFYCGFLLYYPYNVIDVKIPIPIVNKEVKRGEVVEYKILYTKKVNLRAKLLKYLICCKDELTQFTTLYDGQGNIPPFDKKELIDSSIIPKLGPYGTCKISIQAAYQVNPLRTMEYTFETELFTVYE